MLVETHSWKDYATRVKTHYATVLSSLEIAQKYAADWKKSGEELDSQLVTGNVDLEYKHTSNSVMIDFPGYKYSVEKSIVSGGPVIKYDPTSPQTWKIPFYEELESKLTVTAPVEGFFIQPADADWLLPKLNLHRIKFSPWKGSRRQKLNVFRATKSQFSSGSFEGHQTLVVEGEWKEEEVQLPKGVYFVPIHQAKARMVVQLFEPRAQDSFLSWGYFNRAFEQKEYMEHYVVQDVAIEMLKSPEVKAEFETRLKNDQEFAKSPGKRFEFFYRKHPSWDERFNKYPVYKR